MKNDLTPNSQPQTSESFPFSCLLSPVSDPCSLFREPCSENWYVDQRTTGWDAMFTFSGKERDQETGYSYFGARYYDSDLSIWLSVDPLTSKYPSHSPYNYCMNNPIKLVDPDGMRIIYPEDRKERRQVKQALRSLKSSSETAKFHINRVGRDKKHDVQISLSSDRGNSFIPKSAKGATTDGEGSGGRLYWNPNDTNIPDNLVDGTNTVSPERALLEEMTHASRSVAGEIDLGDSKANLEEGWSTHFENANEEIETNVIVNKSMREMGKPEKQRKTYQFNIIKHDKDGGILDVKTINIPIPDVVTD